MRLIDADKLIEKLRDFKEWENDSRPIHTMSEIQRIDRCINFVQMEPTAYDEDKLINQLKRDKIINAATNALKAGKQMDKIGKMISATIEARIQNELEQECKDLDIQVQEEPIAKLLGTINEMYFGDIFPIGCPEPPKQDISTLKKRIKYCKNPMEKKKLEQELNASYKEQKRNREAINDSIQP